MWHNGIETERVASRDEAPFKPGSKTSRHTPVAHNPTAKGTALASRTLQLRSSKPWTWPRKSRVEELLRGRDIRFDVVLCAWLWIHTEQAEIVTPIDRSAHDDDPFKFAEGGLVSVDGGADIGRRGRHRLPLTGARSPVPSLKSFE